MLYLMSKTYFVYELMYALGITYNFNSLVWLIIQIMSVMIWTLMPYLCDSIPTAIHIARCIIKASANNLQTIFQQLL